MRDDQLTKRFCECIEATVKELIPVQQILQTYMGQDTRDIDIDGEVQDTDDPDVLDGPDTEETMEPEPFLESEHLPENEPMMGEEEQFQPTGLENEFKTVPGVQTLEPEPEPEPHPESTFGIPPQAVDEDEGVLFGDAPDHRVKKTAYN